jgi:hypothetical protein
MVKKKENIVPDSIPLFDDGTTKKSAIEKKTKKKLKQKTWLYVKGWTRDNKIFSMNEISDEKLTLFNNLIKAIKSWKNKEPNWDPEPTKVYEKYPRIKPEVIDEFEAYVPTGIDLCYQDESVRVIKPGSADSIDSITLIRGTEEDLA